ncbi:TonB-dependent receptor [Pseudoalteromonas xiamenensis]|uniref:TonB-dependent receptor n=1 Tax=Pseudoalteromonas xiamenensis TaxID=882626 RepID=UPI0027E48FC3|nr:TonB-dependent receptor [Pseudoalteromonas xiamenensis]WMN59796.1 TonB-dependent receptor [Pseudoalteromonas xiamenensis]
MFTNNFKKSLLAVNVGLILSGTASINIAYAADENQASESVEVIEVRGIRRSLEASLNTKRFANAVVDSITAEDIGKMPDKNIAESLQRIPGVSITRNFAGEGGSVSIRGTNPELTNVSLNGNYVASTGWFSQQAMTRSFDMDLMPTEMVAGVDVYKSPTASIDEGGVGGTVVMRTRKPLQLDSLTIFGSLEAQDNSISDGTGYGGTGLVSWKNDEETWGFLGALSTLETVGRAHKAENYLDDSWAGAGIAEFNQTRKRDALNFVVQFAPSANLDISLNYFGVDLDAGNSNQNYLIIAGSDAADFNSKVTGATGLSPTEGFAVNGTFAGGPYDDQNTRNAEVDTKVYSVDVDYKADNYSLNAKIGKTEASGGDGGNYGIGWTSQAPNQQIIFDMTHSKDMLLQPVGTDASNHAEYVMGVPNVVETIRSDEESFAQIDFDFPVEFGAVTNIKSGLKFRDHEFSSYANKWDLGAGVNLDANGNLLTKADFADGTFDHSGVGLIDGSPRNVARVDGDKVRAHVDKFKTGSTLQKAGWGKVKEDIFAAYVQGDFSGESYRGNVGLRYVSTEASAQYYDFVSLSSIEKEKNEYADWLPSFNLAVDLAEDVILRASASKVMSRPNYSYMNPASSYNDTTKTYTRGSIDLDPYRATQADIGVEWYFNESSLFSVTLFNKDISSFVISGGKVSKLEVDGETRILKENVQGLGGKIEGIEFQYQQSFGDFGLLANVTYAEGYGLANQLDSNGALVGVKKEGLPGLSKLTYNLTGYYETEQVALRLAYNYRDDYIAESTGIGGNAFWDAHAFLDLSATWHVNENVDLSLEATNLLEETTVQRLSVYNAMRLHADNGRNTYLKVSYRF